MKGRLYNPYKSNSPTFYWKAPEFKESENKILYLWDTSIPAKWHNISKKNNIQLLKINKKNKNTLQFLEETQRYISFITKPLVFEENFVKKSRSPTISNSLGSPYASCCPSPTYSGRPALMRKDSKRKLDLYKTLEIKGKEAILGEIRKNNHSELKGSKDELVLHKATSEKILKRRVEMILG